MPEKHPFPIGIAVYELSRLIRREVEARTRHLGFSAGQWRTLWHLGRNQGISQARLSDILEMQPISLVRVLDRLEASGLIERRPDPHDRRAVQLYLAPAAGPIMDQLEKIGIEIQSMLAREISPADLECFLAVAQQMQQFLETPARSHDSELAMTRGA